MKQQYLLDTCALIWTANGDEIASEASDAMLASARNGDALWVSPISAWEIGILVARGRLNIAGRPLGWFQNALDAPFVELAAMDVDILIESSFLPATPPNDPADRIIITSAREFGLTIITRDRLILDYARQGHVNALGC